MNMLGALFPVHRPSFGLSVRASALSMVALRRTPLCLPVVTRVLERPLSAGWLTPAAAAPNIADMESLRQELRALTETVRDRAVAVSLPDDAATIGLFTFDALPEREQERQAVIRWRFQQDGNLRMGTERLVYRVYPGDATLSVLAAAVDESVLAQYAALFDEAHLFPVSIGFETLQLFDVFRSAMPWCAEGFFAHYDGDSLTFTALRNGRPLFLRKRRLESSGEHLRDELFGTLQYFDDRYPRLKTAGGGPCPLYFVDTRTVPPAGRAFPDRTTMTVPATEDARSVDVIPFGWPALPLSTGGRELSASFLPAAACVGIA